MKRLAVAIAALVLAAVSLSAPAVPSSAELIGVQQAPWGLQTFGQSRTLGRFSSLGWALEEANGLVYVGGNFLEVTNGSRVESQPYLAAFATSTGQFHDTFRPSVGGPILSIEASPDGALFVGGELGTWNGTELGALAKIDPVTGQPWPGWNTRVYGGTSTVRDVSLEPDGWLYVVGTFTTASDGGGPRPVSNVVRMNPSTGAIDWSWLPRPNGAVWGVSVSRTQPTVYLAGWFSIAGKPAVGLSTTDASRVTWSGFVMNFGCCGHMYDVQATEHGTVMFVGEQHGAYLYDETQNMRIVTSHATSYNSRYQRDGRRYGGDYQSVVQVGDRLYATCHCWGSHSTMMGGIMPFRGDLAWAGGTHTGRISAVVAYDARTGERVTSFNPYMSGDLGGFDVLGASDGCLWVTGGINAVGDPGNQRPGRDLVRLCDEGGGTPPPVPAPESCTATFQAGTVTVTWPPVIAAVDYVIFRSVNDGAPSWRGRVTGVTFTDTDRSAPLTYFVLARNPSGQRSSLTNCTNEVLDATVPLEPPPACTATVSGDVVEVTWETALGAADYVIYRTVDGGTAFWRGRTAGGSFTDSNRRGTLRYLVASRGDSGELSPPTPCSDAEGTPPPPVVIEPVSSCTVAREPAEVVNAVAVSWPEAAAAAGPGAAAGVEYVISRSVDGGDHSWRGRVTGLSFADTLRKGTIVYGVEVKVGNERSVRTLCTPSMEGE